MKNKAQYLVTSTPITSGASMKEEILHMMGVLSHSCWVLQCWQWSVRKKNIFPEIRSTGTESKKIDFLLSQNSLQYMGEHWLNNYFSMGRLPQVEVGRIFINTNIRYLKELLPHHTCASYQKQVPIHYQQEHTRTLRYGKDFITQ